MNTKIKRKRHRFLKENSRLDAIAKRSHELFTPTIIIKTKEEIRKILLSAPAKIIPIGKHTLPLKKKSIRLKRIQKQANETRMERYAAKLRSNTPKSEVWFQGLFNKENIGYNEYNQVLGHTIPDVLNRRYRFIIEVDGSIHNSLEQKRKDMNKDGYYRKKGYTVYRVIAYNINSYKTCLELIKTLVKTYESARISPVLEQGGQIVNKV